MAMFGYLTYRCPSFSIYGKVVLHYLYDSDFASNSAEFAGLVDRLFNLLSVALSVELKPKEIGRADIGEEVIADLSSGSV